MSAIKLMAVAAHIFIHFTHPQTGAKLYEQMTVEGNEVDNLEKPIGVKAYGPGSKQYRAAEAATATALFKAGRKTLTGEKQFDNQTEIMAKTVFEYVGFDIDGKTINGAEYADRIKLNTEMLNDPENAAMREQIFEKQNDLGNFSKAGTNG